MTGKGFWECSICGHKNHSITTLCASSACLARHFRKQEKELRDAAQQYADTAERLEREAQDDHKK